MGSDRKDTSLNITTENFGEPDDKKVISELSKKVRQMSMLLDEAQKTTKTGSFNFDIEMNEANWSDHNFEILGMDRQTEIPTLDTFLSHTFPGDQQYVRNAIAKTIATGEPYDITVRWTGDDGKLRFINSIGGLTIDNVTGKKFVVGTNHDVTDKKTIEEEIRKIARKHQTIIQTTHDGFFVIDKTGKILECNPAFQRMTGYSEKELLNMFIADIDAKESPLGVKEHIQKVIAQGWDQFETKHRRKDGTIITVDISTTHLQIEGGVFISFARDITTAKIEKELLEARFRIQEFSFMLPLDELLRKCLDEAEQLTNSNSGFFHFVDEDQDNLQIQLWSSSIPSSTCTVNDGEMHYPIKKAGVWADCISERKTVVHNNYQELKHKKGLPPGHINLIRELVVPVLRGNKIKAVLGVGNKPTDYITSDIEIVERLADLAWDIIERKRADLLLKESEKKYRELFNRMESGFAYHEIILNEKGDPVDYRFLAVNPMFEKLTGLKSKNIVNRTVLDVLPGTEKYWFETYGKVALTGKPIRFEHFSKTIGKFFKVLAYSPEKYRFATILEDISEKKQKEKELEEYRNHLEREVDKRTRDLHQANVKLQQEIVNQKNTEALLKASLAKEKELSELKTRFISTISHEFRTPLTSVLSSTELLQRYGQKWNELKFGEHVERTKRAVEYLVKLLEDVLTISRAESGKIGFSPSVIDLKYLCKEVIAESTSQAKENHNFVFKYSMKRKEFTLDPKLLKFILVNLIVNAFKYSPNGGEIKFTVSGDKKNIIFTVSDHGMGISNEDKPFIYDNFFRSKNCIDIPGTGLGLSIVKRSVDLHRGSISFVSKLKAGTTFNVSLPKVYQAADVEPATQFAELNQQPGAG